MIRITLPWPPTANLYWRRVGARTLISRDGRQYRKAVQQLIAVTAAPSEPITSRMALTITAYQPDRRRRDLDNMLKAPLDAMQHSGVYADDSHIDDLRIVRAFDRHHPRLEVVIEPMEATP